MASSFPTSLDAFTNPSSTDAMDSVSVPHATQHSDLNDAVEALEAKVGANSSAVTSSHDYKIAQLEAQGTYTDYSGSITYNNLTLGNGSHGSFYARVGNFVHLYGYIVFGSTTSVTGAVQWSLPITAYQSAPLHPNQVMIENVGTALIDGAAYLASPTIVGAFAKYAGATYVEWQAVSASIPVGTWAANDKIIYDFMYRAA